MTFSFRARRIHGKLLKATHIFVFHCSLTIEQCFSNCGVGVTGGVWAAPGGTKASLIALFHVQRQIMFSLYILLSLLCLFSDKARPLNWLILCSFWRHRF